MVVRIQILTDALTLAQDSACAATAADELLDASIDCVKAIGLDGALLGMNPEGMCIMEIDDFAMVEGMAWSSLWPEEHRQTVEAAVSRAAQGGVARFSAFCPTAKGTPKHWDVLVSPIHDADGKLIRLLSISRDVTREVLVAGERALVSKELSHRIKNLFAVVDGVIGLSARAQPEAHGFAKALRERLVGLGRAVSYVYGERPAAAEEGCSQSIHGLLKELLVPYGASGSESRIVISGEDWPITEGAVTALALVFNELATNALKYGGLATPTGKIAVTTAVAAGGLEIVWRESGDRAVAAPGRAGFGTALLDRTIKLQFGGALERAWLDDGLQVTIRLPKPA